MLVIGSVYPGVALAGEVDSEGEGTAPTVEVPVVPDFDPGGEETGLGEMPAASGDEETGVVELEPEVDPVPPVPSAAAAPPVEAQAPQPVAVPESATPAPAPDPESTQQTAAAPETSEPVANQSVVAPREQSANGRSAPVGGGSSEPTLPSEPSEEQAPSAPPPEPTTEPADAARNISGTYYVVRSGDCLSYIAAALLPADANNIEIADEVARLWQLNKARIGTGDPNLIYAGTKLRLR
jgi:outer membrane biosynthesis protein TonB